MEFDFKNLCVCLCLIYYAALTGQDTITLLDGTKQVHLLRHIKLCEKSEPFSTTNNCRGDAIGHPIRPNSFVNQDPTWIQTKIVLRGDYDRILALKIIGFRGAQSVYWDGKLIGQNGHISENVDSIKYGRYQFYSIIPAHLLNDGEHLLSVKHLKMNETLYNTAYILFGDYLGMYEKDLRENHKMILMFMVFLTSAIFFFIFYFGFGRKISFLFLSAYCLAYCIKSLLKPYQDFYTPDFLIPLMSFKLSHLPANLGSIFLIAFLLWEMAVPRKYWLLFTFSVLSIWGYFGLSESQFLILLMVFSGAIVGYGIIHKIEGILWATIGMLGFIGLVTSWILGYFSYGYFSGVIFFLICMTISVGQRIAKQIYLKQAAQVRSATLENQLLKKSIQPHFILNSLASLQELIDQSPLKASDFVEQLADEFKLVSKISNRKLIPINDELDMCRTHLKIMEYRKSASFKLSTTGITEEETIPPGVFHTLVENGITHGYGNKRVGSFLLSKVQSDSYSEYRLINDGEITMSDKEKLVMGTGLKYVESRLQEAYGNKWTMESKPIEDGWEVKIIIKH